MASKNVEIDDEPEKNTPGTGPLGRKLNEEAEEADKTAAETEEDESRRPRPQFDPRTAPSDYAKGTREHDDDREE